jgi:hypothetical protein
MEGIEKSHCNASIGAALSAFTSLMGCSAQEALRQVMAYGKSDTLTLDASPEISITRHLHNYDQHAVVITEETGQEVATSFFEEGDKSRYRTIFFCDPTDRSKQLKEALESAPDKTAKVGDIFNRPDFQRDWESRFGGTASISGASSAITCVRRGVPIFSVIINYVTRQIFLSCNAGNYVLKIPKTQLGKTLNVDYITRHGERIYFHDFGHTDVRRFVTFLGKSGYRENLIDSKLMGETEIDGLLYYGLPGGPLRVLYLSTLQPVEHEVGLILANGEKIGEWIHWLPFVRFARKKFDDSEPALRLFEVYQDRPHTKEGILMSTPPAYSIFAPFSQQDNRMQINVSKFSDFSNPSRIRATLIVTPYDNDWVTSVVRQYGYRAIELYGE